MMHATRGPRYRLFSACLAVAVIVAISAFRSPTGTSTARFQFQPYVNAWTMSYRGDDGTDSGGRRWEDRMDTTTWHGRPAMRREQIEHRIVPVGGFQRITNVFDPVTLEPLMSEFRQRIGIFTRWEYGLHVVRQIQGRRNASGGIDSTIEEFHLDRSFLDYYGGMYAMILAAQPLSLGKSGSFPALLAPDTVVDVPYRVLGREAVRGVNGSLTPAFKVSVGIASGPGSGNGMFTAWVIDRPPYVLRLTTPAKGGVWSWDEVK